MCEIHVFVMQVGHLVIGVSETFEAASKIQADAERQGIVVTITAYKPGFVLLPMIALDPVARPLPLATITDGPLNG
jgi:hypothetical protein